MRMIKRMKILYIRQPMRILSWPWKLESNNSSLHVRYCLSKLHLKYHVPEAYKARTLWRVLSYLPTPQAFRFLIRIILREDEATLWILPTCRMNRSDMGFILYFRTGVKVIREDYPLEEPFNSPSTFEKTILFQCHIASNTTVRLIDTWLCKAAMTPTPPFGLIRTIQDVDKELNDLVVAAGTCRKSEHPWRNLLQKKYTPHLTMTIMIPFFQQTTGGVNVIATVVSIYYVDKLGMRLLFLEGGVQMLFCQSSWSDSELGCGDTIKVVVRQSSLRRFTVVATLAASLELLVVVVVGAGEERQEEQFRRRKNKRERREEEGFGGVCLLLSSERREGSTWLGFYAREEKFGLHQQREEGFTGSGCGGLTGAADSRRGKEWCDTGAFG
ncbi:hypothetical protein H5410_027348 [Solanum commersonii]|uniref:Uncharacterized protein n=1 Tax=Solanum commersonii TaxID=4109 RepID=A0A9J5Z1K9_SOLCO|nr:hypothetical protein H5410_027348 [Solanum commersonii]